MSTGLHIILSLFTCVFHTHSPPHMLFVQYTHTCRQKLRDCAREQQHWRPMCIHFHSYYRKVFFCFVVLIVAETSRAAAGRQCLIGAGPHTRAGTATHTCTDTLLSRFICSFGVCGGVAFVYLCAYIIGTTLLYASACSPLSWIVHTTIYCAFLRPQH